jgi:hypothetical protein
MLTELHRQHYEELRQKVGLLKEMGNRTTEHRRSSTAEFAEMFLAVQQAGISLGEDLDGAVQSYQTEINKQLRLLEMDLMFLKAARQEATIAQRWGGMGDRIHLLTLYCDAILSEEIERGDRDS